LIHYQPCTSWDLRYGHLAVHKCLFQLRLCQDLFKEGVEFTLSIDFSRSKTNHTVSLFESTIRYVGGILSAYELDGKRDSRLVDKARELADKLVHGWVGNNDIPHNELNFTIDRPVVDEEVGVQLVYFDILEAYPVVQPLTGLGESYVTYSLPYVDNFCSLLAVAGTLVLEWSRLSEYTRNNTYRDLAEKSMRRVGTIVRNPQFYM
jgi:mannosyl-oligosaccharide alpha-1,2-mannosidase